jgi:tRNA (guanine-N7-)-methyltransferase
VLEIGFGMGASLAEQALHEPEKNFLGIEVHPPGVANLCALLAEQKISNVRVLQHDAVEVLRDMIAPTSLGRVQVYFPDPWPKLRHQKRRILQTAFVQVLVQKIQSGGLFHMATDWVPYAEEVLQLCAQQPELRNTGEGFCPRPDFRPETKFEKRGIGIGHDIRDILFTKK